MGTSQLILRDRQRVDFSSAFAHTQMEFLKEFNEHPFFTFNHDGLFAELCKKLFKTHLGVHLTQKESEVLLCLASGFSRVRIEKELNIGKDRVRGLRQSITRKLESAGVDFKEFEPGLMMALLTLRLMGQLV